MTFFIVTAVKTSNLPLSVKGSPVCNSQKEKVQIFHIVIYIHSVPTVCQMKGCIVNMSIFALEEHCLWWQAMCKLDFISAEKQMET
jgi:hypothetical protein